MNNHISSYFREIELDKVKDYYEVEVKYKNRIIELDLNLDTQETIHKDQLIKIDEFLNNLEKHEEEIRGFIHLDFQNEGIAKEYLEFYTDELEENELDLIIGKNDKQQTTEEQLLSKLYIQRIGFYPNDNQFAIFDFHVNHEISDQILVIRVGNDMSYDITWES